MHRSPCSAVGRIAATNEKFVVPYYNWTKAIEPANTHEGVPHTLIILTLQQQDAPLVEILTKTALKLQEPGFCHHRLKSH